MANETEYSNYITLAAYVDSKLGPYFRASNIMSNLTASFNFSNQSKVLDLPKAGSVTAATVAESTEASNSEYTETKVTLTAAKVVVLSELSEESMKFASANPQFLTQQQAQAISAKFDTDCMALFDGFSVSVGSTGVNIDLADLKEATYKLRLSSIPGPYVYIMHPTAVHDIQTEMVAATTSVWSNQSEISLIGGQPGVNGYVGNIFNVNVFESTNIESINSAADWGCACISPQFALAVGYSGGFETKLEENISKGTIEVKTTLYYDVKEYYDLAGVLMLADQ